MAGDKSIAPDRVYSDGVFTYFDYGNRWNESDLPAVYRVVDGVDTPVNTRTKGVLLIAESAGAFTLRNGQRSCACGRRATCPMVRSSRRPSVKDAQTGTAPASPERQFP